MFTGIVEEVGIIEYIQRSGVFSKLTVRAKKILEDINIGDSIAVNGICLTVTNYEKDLFTVDVMNETWERTALYKLSIGNFVTEREQ